MIRILLVRHGSTDLSGHVLYGRSEGIHLNEKGLHEARALAKALGQRYSITGVFSSPLERAIETAEPLAKAFDLPVCMLDGLTEIDFGEWVGRSFAELEGSSEWHDFNRQRTLRCPPNGESMMNVQARAWRAIDEVITGLSDGESVVFVTHGDIIRCLLLLWLGVSIDHIHRLEIAPGSLSEIVISGHSPLIRGVNEVFE